MGALIIESGIEKLNKLFNEKDKHHHHHHSEKIDVIVHAQ